MPAGSGDRGRNTVTDNRETIGDSAVAKAASTRPSCFNHTGRWTRGRTRGEGDWQGQAMVLKSLLRRCGLVALLLSAFVLFETWYGIGLVPAQTDEPFELRCYDWRARDPVRNRVQVSEGDSFVLNTKWENHVAVQHVLCYVADHRRRYGGGWRPTSTFIIGTDNRG